MPALSHRSHHPISPQGPPGTKEPKSQLVLAVPRSRMLRCAPGSQMYPGLWDRAELVAKPSSLAAGLVAEERKYQGTGITAPAPCLAARSCGERGEGGPELSPRPKHRIPFDPSIQARNMPTPGALREPAGDRTKEVKMSSTPGRYPDSKEGKGLSHPVPHQPAGQRGKEPRGTRVGPPHSSRPSLPPQHGCQLEQKTHPQVAIWSHAGLGPSADDRLWALLRPACCAAVLWGRGGAGPIVTA